MPTPSSHRSTIVQARGLGKAALVKAVIRLTVWSQSNHVDVWGGPHGHIDFVTVHWSGTLLDILGVLNYAGKSPVSAHIERSA